MKLTNSIIDFNDLPVLNRLFLVLWKQRKKYERPKVWNASEIHELACSLTPDFHYESPAERTTFNNGLHYDDLFIGWEGKEFVETYWYELNQKLKRRITQYFAIISG